MTEPADRFRAAMGRFATGVAVVTSRLDDHDHAMTASSLTSVSLDPLLLLVCVENDARIHDAITNSGLVGVSILAGDQRSTATWLSTPGRPVQGQLDRVPHHPGTETGVALVDGALAAMECRVEQVHVAGTHSIVVVEVVGMEIPGDIGPALLHYRGRYGTLS